MAKIMRELRAFTQYFLVPLLVTLIPWRYGVKLARRLAAGDWLYAQEWPPALAEAQRFGLAEDAAAFSADFRFLRLLDHADYWLSWTRSKRWHTERMESQGAWPAEPCVGIFFHLGPHSWAARAFHATGRSAAVLAGHYSRRSMGGSVLAHFYGWLRIRQLEADTGRAVIFAPGTLARALATLKGGHWVWGTPDVPTADMRHVARGQLLGRAAKFPTGLVEIARRAGVPLVVFHSATIPGGACRSLRIWPAIDPADPTAIEQIVNIFGQLLRERPAAFFLWPAMPGLLSEPAVSD